MTIAQALYEFLKEQAEITAIVEDRIYPVEIPQPRDVTTFDLNDSIVFRMTGMNADDGISQVGTLAESWDLVCLSAEHARAHELSDLVVSALRGYSGPMPASGGVENAAVALLGGRDEYDEEFAVYCVVLTFSITP